MKNRIMKMTMMITIGIAALLTTGCTGPSVSKELLEAYKIYQSQPTEIENFYMSAAEGETISITGIRVFRIATEAKPKSVLPREPSLAKHLVTEGAGVVKAVTAGYVGIEGLKQAGKTIIVAPADPIIVQPVFAPSE